MASDISRKLFNPAKHYSGVIMQQGRVQLDSDWNEQLNLQLHRTHVETRDVIGKNGVPKKQNSFQISAIPSGFSISPGHMYVGGLLVRLEQLIPYINQPYYPSPVNPFGVVSPSGGLSEAENAEANQGELSQARMAGAGNAGAVDTVDAAPGELTPEGGDGNAAAVSISNPQLPILNGMAIVYIDAWQREVNYLDDALIQEVAIGEADTTTRLQNVWQVKVLPTQVADAACNSELPEWSDLVAPLTGTLNARADQLAGTDDPCILAPSAGYRRLENQLYRVEVHTGGNAGTATFKWSRDNASVETKITQVSGSILTVEEIGKDEILGFAAGNWVEIVNEISSLNGNPYPLVQIQSVDAARREITLTSAPPVSTGILKLRRWDQSGASAGVNGVGVIPGWMDLEGGIQVEFSAGTYKSGDYWLIPARTATGEIEWPPYEIPNTAPIAQAPAGVQHHYCKLAIIQIENGLITQVEDCRPFFPALTEICAEDICYDDSNCSNLNAENVQQAIDLLCAANDLRLHNKLLHGYGVICGMKLKCGPSRDSVMIADGYALDCEGNIIHLNGGLNIYGLISEAKQKGFLQNGTDEQFCLSISGIDASGAPIVDIELYQKKNPWEEILEGGIWHQFYKECIEDLINFLQNQLAFSLSDTPPMTLKQRRLTAIINILIQIINPSSGQYLFVSGDIDPGRTDQSCGMSSNEPHSEDKLLWCFYNALKNKIASETFCAMFDNDTPFPDYEIEPGLDTVFGPPLQAHVHMELNPSGEFAYTAGSSANIYVYNLNQKEYVHVVPFPITANVVIQDIAMHPTGNIIYAVSLIDAKDTVFAMGDIDGTGNITWRPNSMKCQTKFVSIAVGNTGQVYAIGKAEGLFEIVGLGTNAFATNKLISFNATGMFALSENSQMAFAAQNTSNGPGNEMDNYESIVAYDFNSNSIFATYIIPGVDEENDLLCHNNMLYATGETASGQRVLGRVNVQPTAVFLITNLDNDSQAIRMDVMQDSALGDRILLTYMNLYKVVSYSIANQHVDPFFRIPTQMFPIGIRVSRSTNKAYVLNAYINTLTEIDIPLVFHNSPAPDYTMEPPQNLANYRNQVIQAYGDLLGHFAQYLKDCFCDQYLIDCPTCDKDDKVYLGVVEVKDGKVYKICNFTKRKYVKSFSTYGHWLSTVPVLPVLKKAFTEFCCHVFNP